MKKLIFLFFITCSLTSVAQKDSLQLGDRYAEDQLYVMVSYNQLFNQPAMVKGSRFFLWLVYWFYERSYFK